MSRRPLGPGVASFGTGSSGERVGRRSGSREVAGYGLRAQIGGVVTLLNLRLDFVLLDVATGPAVLGMYAIASKYAELLSFARVR